VELLAALPPEHVLWVGPESERFTCRTAADVRGLLGLGFQVAVLDLHSGFDPDVLGQVHGVIWGGGRLILRLPPAGAPPPRAASLAVFPYGVADVGDRTWNRLERWLAAHPAVTEPHEVRALTFQPRATPQQDQLVEQLQRSLGSGDPAVHVLTADRGRGKSAAVGRALRGLPASRRVVVTAVDPPAVHELLAFAEPHPLAWTPPEEALSAEGVEVVVVDEAARFSLPWLRRLLAAHPRAHVVLATTTRGYEGTGRGFALRFVEGWRDERPLRSFTLGTPIRFGSEDPLEAWVLGVLGLEGHVDPEDAELQRLFGLLADAHYRTTPSDLQRLLDAPNLGVHRLDRDGELVVASVVAREGRLPAELCADLYAGRERIRGHALPDTLICHCGEVEAGRLTMARSVRIATRPSARRQGHAARLVERVHAAYDVDLFGTLFGATRELVQFRQALGYQLVRLGSSRGARTGEPTAVMIRPVSPAARELVARLRGVLARELSLQLDLLAAEGDPLDDGTIEALAAGLPAPTPLTEAERDRIVHHWLHGPRTYEAAAYAVRAWVEARTERGPRTPAEAAVLEAKVLRGLGWRAAATQAGVSVPAAMRILRRAVAALEAPQRITTP
jgi:tRNA(Met) cytidine acetyltransferase